MDVDPLRTLLAPVMGAGIEVANKLILLGVDRDRWLIGGLDVENPGVDVHELVIPVGVLTALVGLDIAPAAEAELLGVSVSLCAFGP
jgi:hypothetical protein